MANSPRTAAQCSASPCIGCPSATAVPPLTGRTCMTCVHAQAVTPPTRAKSPCDDCTSAYCTDCDHHEDDLKMGHADKPAAPAPCDGCTANGCLCCDHFGDEPAAPAPARAPVNTVALDQFMAALDQLQSVDASLAALIDLLDAASGKTIAVDHISALLSPVYQRMASACDTMGDLELFGPFALVMEGGAL
jgi:hypothetical protein